MKTFTSTILQTPDCGYQPTVVVVTPYDWLEQTDDGILIYTTDINVSSGSAQAVIEMYAYLDNVDYGATAETNSTYNITVNFLPCDPTVTLEDFPSALSYTISDPPEDITYYFRQDPNCGYNLTFDYDGDGILHELESDVEGVYMLQMYSLNKSLAISSPKMINFLATLDTDQYGISPDMQVNF